MIAEIIHALVQDILERPERRDWTIQGFGMLRTYLPFDMRLNIWNSRFRIQDVSEIHTHPWHFESYVERGRLMNMRYERLTEGAATHDHALLKPGPNGGVLQQYGGATLSALNPEFYGAGERYSQKASEIHMTRPSDGCVTINVRERVGVDEALVFWPRGETWVSAEPRNATAAEVEEFVLSARKSLAKAERPLGRCKRTRWREFEFGYGKEGVMKERGNDMMRYEIHWITNTGKHCVGFGDSAEESGERGMLLDALRKDPSVILVQIRKITIEVL